MLIFVLLDKISKAGACRTWTAGSGGSQTVFELFIMQGSPSEGSGCWSTLRKAPGAELGMNIYMRHHHRHESLGSWSSAFAWMAAESKSRKRGKAWQLQAEETWAWVRKPFRGDVRAELGPEGYLSWGFPDGVCWISSGRAFLSSW